jgi:hypothetical protein
MDQRQQHYLRDYWKEAGRRAWRDAQHFESHVWWELALLAAALIVAPTVAGMVLHLKDGLETLAIASGAVFFWYLFVVTPARISRDLTSRAEDSEKKKDEAVAQYHATHPILDVSFEWVNFRASLSIHNTGAAVEYLNARLSFIHGFPAPPQGNIFCQGGYREPLPKGSTIRLLLAELRPQVHVPGWIFYYSNDGQNRVLAISPQFLIGASIEVEVSCHPENPAGTIRKRITCSGGLYGQTLRDALKFGGTC